MSAPAESTAETRMVSPLLMLGAASVLTHTAQAGEPEPLDEDFLDYLSQLEGDDDDWTLFDSEDAKPAATPAAAKTEPRKESVPATAKEPVVKATKVAPPKQPAEVQR